MTCAASTRISSCEPWGSPVGGWFRQSTRLGSGMNVDSRWQDEHARVNEGGVAGKGEFR